MAESKTEEKTCGVTGCGKPAERSVNIKKVRTTSLDVPDMRSGQVHLCKDHYRTFKKESKDSIPDYLGN